MVEFIEERYIFLFIFVPEMLVLRIPNLASEFVMKRESGENPEQTRCCKASLNPSQGGDQDAAKLPMPLFLKRNGKDLRFEGKVRRPATVSQLLMAFGK
ncbi:hypothetical protein SDC9_89737 [bioreactor metagenome]|uniref:Uncharacterized protein n=1 Tax=bioreactor metagenome TaxID=1076179 RepID=A0A644ZZR6_9ZZZZ